METIAKKTNIILEEETTFSNVLFIGKGSQLAAILRELLISKGLNICSDGECDYIFQLDDIENIGVFLEKAVKNKAKYFLILDENIDIKIRQQAISRVSDFIQKRKLIAKIFNISLFPGQEIDTARKILKLSFSQTEETKFDLKGNNIFIEKPQYTQKRNYSIKKNILHWTFYLLMISAIIISPIIFILANIFLGTLSLKNTSTSLLNSNFISAKNQAKSAQAYFTTAENTFELGQPIPNFLGKDKQARQFKDWLELGKDLGQASEHLINVGQRGQELVFLILGLNRGNLKETLTKVTADLALNEREFATIEAKLPQLTSYKIGNLSFTADNLKQVKTIRKGLSGIRNLLV
ncbi:MAG: hypothetical protein V1858_01780, partial [Candidatus Gottesmanbacteria bacterium]